jgi:hypothetical protein
MALNYLLTYMKQSIMNVMNFEKTTYDEIVFNMN